MKYQRRIPDGWHRAHAERNLLQRQLVGIDREIQDMDVVFIDLAIQYLACEILIEQETENGYIGTNR